METSMKEKYEELSLFIGTLNPLISKVKIDNSHKKDMLLAAFTRLIIMHTQSIHLLIEKKLPNSAHALFRPLFETILRMKYMYYIMDLTNIDTLYDATSGNEKFLSPKSMAEKIDAHLEVEFYTRILNDIKKHNNDFTHTGIEQIASMFDSNGNVSMCKNYKRQLEMMSNTLMLLKSSMTIYLSIGIKNGDLSEEDVKKLLL